MNGSSIKAFDVQVKDLAWHPNEGLTRWFLVLRSHTIPELSKLLDVCNGVARDFGQPQLYAEPSDSDSKSKDDQFHISIAWSLQAPVSKDIDTENVSRKRSVHEELGVPYELLGQVYALTINFAEVKVRIGQDVHAIALKSSRQVNSLLP